MKVYILLIVIFGLMSNVIAIKWLALSNISHHKNVCAEARRLNALTRGQVRLCNEVLLQLKAAASLAVSTCQQAFSTRRWNCSSVVRAPNFGPDLTTGTREQAIVHAISAASLVHTLARACAQGQVRGCTCAPSPKSVVHLHSSIGEGGFKWGGCGDNVKWAVAFARRFLDAHHKTNIKSLQTIDTTALQTQHSVKLHNNKAGRKLVEKSARLQCKCHGVSGSCSVKTCWRALAPSLGELQSRLLQLYATAVDAGRHTIGSGGGKWEADKWHISGGGKLEADKRLKDELLVYLTKSPDHCYLDEKQGSVGTTGRTCNATATGHFGCESMCCGRGHTSHVEESQQRCHCRYHWCCYVKCKTCTIKLSKHICK
nr:Wnt11 [Nilaparvata lugens]